MVMLGLVAVLVLAGGVGLLVMVVFLMTRSRHNQPNPGHRSEGWNPYFDSGMLVSTHVGEPAPEPGSSLSSVLVTNPDAASQFDLTPPVSMTDSGNSDSGFSDSGSSDSGSSDSGSSSDSSSSSSD